MKRTSLIPLALGAVLLAGCSSVVDEGDARYEPTSETEVPEEADTPAPSSAETQPAPSSAETEESPDTADQQEAAPPEDAGSPGDPSAENGDVRSPDAGADGIERADETEGDAETIYGPRVVSERGYIVKDIGQLAALADAAQADAILVEFTVTAIGPNYTCPREDAPPPENGSFIAVSFDVRTTPALGTSSWPEFNLSAYDMKILSPDGVRENDSIGNGLHCLSPAERLPFSIGPAEQASGKIVLDSSQTSGYLVVGDGGYAAWEWRF